MRAVVYSRVSTDAQERDGTSLDTQESNCVAYAGERGWQLVECIRDAASGFSLARSGIERVREMLRRRDVDLVLAYAVDRLSRNQNQIGVLFDEASSAGVRLEFVTEKFEDTAIGRFILAARAFVAEVEREKIAERTSRGKAQRARSGRIPQGTGRGIYGYLYDRDSGTRRVDSLQAPVVLRMFEEFVAGKGVSGIASGLNRDGIPAYGGGRWYPLTVRRTLLNETYTGRTVYCRTRVEFAPDRQTGKRRRRVIERDAAEWIDVPGASPPIVSVSLFGRAQELLNDPDRQNRGHATDVYRLRGRLRCITCGTPMVGQTLMRGRYRYYRCRDSYTKAVGGSCTEKYVPRDLLEDAVLDELVTVLTDPHRLRAELVRSLSPTPSEDSGADLEKTLAAVQEKQKRLTRLFVAGELPEEVLQAEAGRLQAERRLVETRLGAARRARPTAPTPADVEASIPLIADRVGTWIRSAAGEALDLLLTGLDLKVKACRERALIEVSIPLDEMTRQVDRKKCLVTTERTSASRKSPVYASGISPVISPSSVRAVIVSCRASATRSTSAGPSDSSHSRTVAHAWSNVARSGSGVTSGPQGRASGRSRSCSARIAADSRAT